MNEFDVVTQNLFDEWNLDDKTVNRSANVLVLGGNGTGKTFKYIKPNILQKNCSLIITDPDEKTYAKVMGLPYEELKLSPEEEAAIKAKWDIIYSDVAEILREINPALSEEDSLKLADGFFLESYPYDYLYDRRHPTWCSVAEFDMKDAYGAEPFFFTEDNHIQAVNKPVFKEWVNNLIEMGVYAPEFRD